LNIFVRNLSHEVREEDLRDFFAFYGDVAAITLIGGPELPVVTAIPKGYVSNHEARGYAYVQMPDETEALAAISGVHGKHIRGLAVTVLQALPLEKKKNKK
jgi:RNA recognition motif-containing protein